MQYGEGITEIIGESLEEYLRNRALYGAYLKQYDRDKKGKKKIEEIESTIETSKELTDLVVFMEFLKEARFQISSLPEERDAKKERRPLSYHVSSQ